MSNTTTFTVGDVVDELDERLDKIADEATAAESGTEEEQRLDQQGTTVDQRLRAFEALVEENGRDASIEVSKLSPDDRVNFGSLLSAAKRQWEEREGVETTGEELRDVYWTAAGVTDAPWLDGDEDLQERSVALRTVGPDWHAIQYLKGRVTEVNTLESGNSKSYAERRRERAETTGPG